MFCFDGEIHQHPTFANSNLCVLIISYDLIKRIDTIMGTIIFLPSGIDVLSSIIWGITSTAVGGIIVELIRGNLSSGKAFSRGLIVLTISGIIWLACYNLPLYGFLALGNAVSATKSDCTGGLDYWYQAFKMQPKSGLPYLNLGSCYYSKKNY